MKKQKKQKSGYFANLLSCGLMIGCLYAVISSKDSYGQSYLEVDRPAYDVVTKYASEDTSINQKELKCLTDTIFFEVRKYDEEDMKYVASVVLNRVKHSKYPETICENVYKSGQFEWVTHNYKLGKILKKNILEKKSYELAKVIAKDSIIGGSVLSQNVVAYHANHIKRPNSKYWRNLKVLFKSNLHTYYAENSKNYKNG